ncbi:hypothetical protein EBB59_06480 [Lysobacter pythonis]|uniref:Uncharacterized protein n=1 Tax=Solilutibacter pythonis TaxID=2483112 RepID=A0A3M2HVY1_9GAMM|nr:hypothetical protein [Lysobacter pythonis]RMH93178.1 hypothetical protein EBB59_06480 [Lysobacter pythonis]
MAAPDPDLSVLALMALEWMPDAPPPHPALAQQEAGQLAERIGHDLALLVPAVASLDLLLLGAHFDPAEVLRPGWPVHRRLHELRLRAPGRGGGPRIIAFGADGEDVPQPLHADAAFQGGTLRVLPLLLAGQDAAAVGAELEASLLDRGMARSETALQAQAAFASRIEHARYLTVHDLAAMTALQYRHMGLEPLWPLIETALLAPGEEVWLDAPPEPLLRFKDGEVRIALFSDLAWRRRYAPVEAEPARLERMRGYFEARQRQLAAVLGAHGIDVTYVDCPADADPRIVLG